MQGIEVNPMQVRVGDKLATKHRPTFANGIEVIRARQVKKVEICGGKVECVHIDHECYDSRFSTVVVATG